MSKFVRIVGIGAAAAAAMCLLDPDRGRTRRAKLSDQAAAMARKAEEKLVPRRSIRRAWFRVLPTI